MPNTGNFAAGPERRTGFDIYDELKENFRRRYADSSQAHEMEQI
jgi:hypothetical protein